MLVNVLIWRRRLAVIVAQGTATEREASLFLRWTTAFFVGGPLLMGIVGLMANWSSPFCAGFMQFTDIPHTLVSLITVSGWVALLWWIWRRGGAEFLARVAPALDQRSAYAKTYSPRVIRLIITTAVLISSVGVFFAQRTMPVLPEQTCRIAPPAG